MACKKLLPAPGVKVGAISVAAVRASRNSLGRTPSPESTSIENIPQAGSKDNPSGEAFSTANDLEAPLSRPDDPASLEQTAAAIDGLSERGALPDAVAGALLGAYREMGEPAVTGRSAATGLAEDGGAGG